MNVRRDILGVARNLGARLRRSGGEWVGPCPVCGGTDRFAINPSKGLWNCRGCGRGGDTIDLVRHVTGSSFASAVELVDGSPSTMSPPPSPQPPPLKTTTESAIRIWRASVDPRGTAVERYLTSRGLALDDDVAGSVIRWNPAAQWRDDRRPKAAMVCLMRSISEYDRYHKLRRDEQQRRTSRVWRGARRSERRRRGAGNHGHDQTCRRHLSPCRRHPRRRT